MKTKLQPLARAAAVIALLLLAAPITHAFSYQGVLSQNGTNAQGQFDMTFQLLESGTTTPVGSPVSKLVDVTNGLFQVDLAFDPLLFDGTPYDLQISVQLQAGPIYVLSPPSPMRAAPTALFANSVGSVPDGALASNVARLDQPAIFLTTVTMPVLRVTDATGSGRIVFGPTDDCTVGIDPSGPGGLLLRDPRGIRILSPSPTSPPVLRFGPTDDCSLGIDPAFPGLVERDPIGLRLLGQNNQGCRLIFGPTMDCTVEIQPSGPPGLLLRDPSGIRILPLNPGAAPRLRFGPTDDCSLGIDPTGATAGLLVEENFGLRVTNPNGGASRVIVGGGFGNNPDNLCVIASDPAGPSGLQLRDPVGVRLLSPPGSGPTLIFGPTDDCSLGIDPARQGLRVAENYGLRLFGNSGTGDRLIFGPTDDCTIGIDPNRQGLRVAENYGLRLLGASGTGDRVIFGPTDDCTIGIDPNRQGLRVAENYGLRLFGASGTGDRVIFGPTDDCSIGIDPTRQGLRVAENYGLRLYGASGTGDRVIFGPTDDCTIGIDPLLQGLRVAENVGLRLHGNGGNGCRLIFGPTMDCTVEIQPGGPSGLLLRDPSGIRVLPVDPSAVPQLIFGPTDDCRLSVDPTGTTTGLIVYEPNGVRLIDQLTAQPRLIFGPTDDCTIGVAGGATGGASRLTFDDPNGFLFTNDVEVVGMLTETSTRRLKDNIQPLENALDLLQQLQGVRYDWKPEMGGKPDIGFIAEEVGKVFPEIVAWEEDGTDARGLNYGRLVAVAVEGIKAQQTEIDTLRKDKADMESRLARLEALLLNNTQPE